MPVSSREPLIASYLESLPRLRRAVEDLSPEQLRARPVPGKWSTLEVVCHLVDSEQAWCHRMKRVIVEDRPVIIGYDQDRFTAGLAYHEADLEEELSLLEAMRRQMARILRDAPDAAWSRTCEHNEYGPMTLEQMVRAEAEHVPHHLTHILEKRRALGLSGDFPD